MKKLRRRNVSEEAAVLYKRTAPEKVLYGFVFVIFLIYALSLILPFVWLFINSLQDKTVLDLPPEKYQRDHPHQIGDQRHHQDI